jgi:hypothetical protein
VGTFQGLKKASLAVDCQALTGGIRGTSATALADLIGTVLASLRNHKGRGVQRANEGSPARWRLGTKLICYPKIEADDRADHDQQQHRASDNQPPHSH